MAMKFDKKANRNLEICNKQAQKTSNFNINKQPVSLKKNRKSTKKQAQIRGKTARLAILGCSKIILWCVKDLLHKIFLHHLCSEAIMHS